MKLLKKTLILATMMSLLITISFIPATGATNAKITIDGVAVSISSTYGTTYIDSANRMMVPLRVLSEKLGEKVTWDGATNTVSINGEVKVKVGSAQITTPYETITMDTKATIKSGRVYVPIRYIGNALGYKITSENKSGIVTANVITKADLTISAAASLKAAMADIQALYKAEKPNSTLTVNLGASGTLQQQIEQGGDVDLFFSAATKNMTALKEGNLLINTTVKNLLKNKVVLVVPEDSKTTINSFAGITDPSIEKIGLGEPTVVPAGDYAQQVFTYLNILDKVKAKAVYGQDVKQVLTWVETGNVDAGVVYSTDAKISTKVKVIATASDESHKSIIYPAAVIKTTKNPEAAKDFLNFLSSDKAHAVFEKYGFTVL